MVQSQSLISDMTSINCALGNTHVRPNLQTSLHSGTATRKTTQLLLYRYMDVGLDQMLKLLKVTEEAEMLDQTRSW